MGHWFLRRKLPVEDVQPSGGASLDPLKRFNSRELTGRGQ